MMEDIDKRRLAEYAAVAQASYGDYDFGKDPAGLERRGIQRNGEEGGLVRTYDPKLPGWEGGSIRDDASGAHARAFLSNRGEMVIGFSGTDGLQDVIQGNWANRGMNQYRAMDEKVRQAVEYARDRGWKVVFTGHSLGVFPAQMYAVKYGAEAYPFNSGELTGEQYKTALREKNDYFGGNATYAPVEKVTKVNTHTDFLDNVKGTKLGRQYYIALDNDEWGHSNQMIVDALDNDNEMYDEEGIKDFRRERGRQLFGNFSGWGH